MYFHYWFIDYLLAAAAAAAATAAALEAAAAAATAAAAEGDPADDPDDPYWKIKPDLLVMCKLNNTEVLKKLNRNGWLCVNKKMLK